jgi:hypothetical protein
MEKECSRCKEIKTIEKFGKVSKSKDGYSGLCKNCRNGDSSKSKFRKKNNIKIVKEKIEISEKVCSRCNQNKSIENFGKRKASKDGYYGLCKICKNDDCRKSKKNKIYTEEEILLEKERKRKYYIENKDVILIKNKIYRSNNKDSAKIYKNFYYSENREKLIKYSCDYHLNRMKSDPIYRLGSNIRCLVKNSLKYKGYKKSSKTIDILGCTIDEFKLYLESKFESWMSWDNHGLFNGELNYGWDVDHIIPLASAETEEDIIRLNHHTNLQPLCSYINRHIKKDRLDYK